MICPSLVFDHFRYSPNCAFEYQHEDGVVVFVFIRFKGFSRHLSRGWADMKLHPFLVYIGIMISSWACGQLVLKDMKRLGFLIISFLLTSVCVLGQTKPQDQHTMDYVGQRILTIYKDAFNNPTTSFKKYFTTELYTLYLKSVELTEQGDLGVLDYDIWSQSQDPYKPTAAVYDLILFTSKTAGARVQIKDGDYKSSVLLYLNYERGNWFINEIEDEGGSLRARIADYIGKANYFKIIKQ